MSLQQHWFISDTHFCESRPDHIDAFEKLCEQPKTGDSVLLLGDIFEIWITDDLASKSDLKIESILKRMANRGVSLYFMHGNRDFMVGKRFALRTGATLLPDPYTWKLPNGQACVLTHGDWFCTDDRSYRRYRRIVRNPVFQFCFRHLPKTLRMNIASNIRKSSIENHEQNANRRYDANTDLIEQYYKKYSPVEFIIMGHTHLPNIHKNGTKKRIVLGDWRENLWYGIAGGNVTFELREADLELKHIKQQLTV